MNAKKCMNLLITVLAILILCLLAFGFLFAPNDPTKTDMLSRLQENSSQYPLGTDAMGRCIYSRILYGGKTTLGIVLGGAGLIFIIGSILGMAISKWVVKQNALIDGIINAVTAIPPIAYLIVFMGAWGNGISTMMLAMTASYVLRYIRLARTRIDIESEKAYVSCAIASGASKVRILTVHIFPNILSELIQFLCLSCADMILTITGFSFIGLGLGDNVVDWGTMILDARSSLILYPTMIIYPMMTVLICALCFNVLGKKIIVR